jgi:hypothetical protein
LGSKAVDLRNFLLAWIPDVAEILLKVIHWELRMERQCEYGRDIACDAVRALISLSSENFDFNHDFKEDSPLGRISPSGSLEVAYRLQTPTHCPEALQILGTFSHELCSPSERLKPRSQAIRETNETEEDIKKTAPW